MCVCVSHEKQCEKHSKGRWEVESRFVHCQIAFFFVLRRALDIRLLSFEKHTGNSRCARSKEGFVSRFLNKGFWSDRHKKKSPPSSPFKLWFEFASAVGILDFYFFFTCVVLNREVQDTLSNSRFTNVLKNKDQKIEALKNRNVFIFGFFLSFHSLIVSHRVNPELAAFSTVSALFFICRQTTNK